jgi:hypothetical protein
MVLFLLPSFSLYGSERERQLVEDLARLQKSKGRGRSVKIRSNNGNRPRRNKRLPWISLFRFAFIINTTYFDLL